MADYTRAELLNEVSKIFRAGLSPGSSGGALDTASEYQQLLEMASITFLLNSDSVFYVARLAANQLTSTLSQEVAVLEDILVSLDDLGQIGTPVRDTVTLSNARTSILSLDAAQSVVNRPETSRFLQQMDTFAEGLRKNLVSSSRGGAFVRPREEARNLIQRNLVSLAELHERLLDQLESLLKLLDSFLELDLPSKVSTSVLSSVSSRLQSAAESVSTSSDVENLATNRKLFLETLANKISVKVLSTFTDPTGVKYRSPVRPIPSTLKHLGQVVGSGEAASVITTAGPWTLPISTALILQASGGSPVTVPINDAGGAVLNARNSQSYDIPAESRNLHVVVDPEIREGEVLSATTTEVVLTDFMPLGFKHLGAAVSFPDIVPSGSSVSRSKTVANVTADIPVDTNVTGAVSSPNLNTVLGDYSSVSFVADVDIYLNGRLLRNGSDGTTTNDVYPGTNPSTGDLKFKVPLHVTPGDPDVITMVVNGASSTPGGGLNDLNLRYIEDMRLLRTIAAGDVVFSNPYLNITPFTPVEELSSIVPVGAYIVDSSGNRYEVVRSYGSTYVEIDTRGETPDFSSGFGVRGQFSTGTGTTKFFVAPALDSAPTAGDTVRVGPSVKTAQLSVGSLSVADIISDIEAEVGVFDPGHDGAKLNWHVKAEPVVGDSTRLALRVRSGQSPFIQISGRFVHIKDPVGLATTEEESAHRILGFLEGESDTINLLTPGELAALVSEQPGFSAEVVTTELASGTLETTAGAITVTDELGTDFSALLIQTYDQIEILDGISAGTYRVSYVSTPTSVLELMRSPFEAKESGLAYRIFREQVRISITDSSPGSFLTVSDQYDLGLFAGSVYSSMSEFEAVDKLGNKLSFTGVLPGDLLKVVGHPEVVIKEVINDTTLSLETGLPSNVSKVGFEIRSASAKEYTAFIESLTSFVTSSHLLKKNGFDKGVDAIDVACTSAILPGQSFTSSRNQARRLVVDLLAILSDTFSRGAEYTAVITANPNNLNSLLSSYAASPVEAVNDLLDSFLDRKYERAASLLRSGKFTEFYGTNDETGSYSGAVVNASRTVVRDLPRVSRTRFDFLNQRDLARSTQTLTDADKDFSDTEGGQGELDI